MVVADAAPLRATRPQAHSRTQRSVVRATVMSATPCEAACGVGDDHKTRVTRCHALKDLSRMVRLLGMKRAGGLRLKFTFRFFAPPICGRSPRRRECGTLSLRPVYIRTFGTSLFCTFLHVCRKRCRKCECRLGDFLMRRRFLDASRNRGQLLGM